MSKGDVELSKKRGYVAFFYWVLGPGVVLRKVTIFSPITSK